jgi:Mrp family chromosome partitioning ATPase
VLDCDFGNQECSRLLLGDGHRAITGITDVMDEVVSAADAAHRVDLGNDSLLRVMPRGTRPALATSLFQSEASRLLFDDLVDTYDLVVMDGPPLLQVAYASTLAELAQGLLVVVGHGVRQSELADLRNRLELIGTPVLGYVYNRSPLRREMTMTEGSMMDILGDSTFEPDVELRPSRRV